MPIINSLSSMCTACEHGGITGGGNGTVIYTTGGCGDISWCRTQNNKEC